MKGRHIFGENGKPDRYLIDGKEVTREEYEEAFPDQPLGIFGTHHAAGWPVISDSLAVHPNQVEEATEDAKKKGVPTEFLPDGRPVMRSKEHFTSYARRYGFRHRGYD